jgi:hypothetical protein
MKGPELSQFTTRFQVQYRRSFKPAESQAFLRDLLLTIAESCVSRGAAIIGHIKLLATTSEGGYFHGSVTSTRTPPTVEPFDVFPHDALTVALVVLVYGITEGEIENIVNDVWNELTDEGDEIIVHQKTDPSLPNQEEVR